MGNPKRQHQLVVRLSNLFPRLGDMVVSTAGISVPSQDQREALRAAGEEDEAA